MALKYAGIQVEHREIALRSKPKSMLLASPKGTVPVLCVGKLILDQSLDIMRWALEQSDPDGWMGVDGEVSQTWIGKNDGPFKVNLDRYKYPQRFGLAQGTRHRDEAAVWLHTLDARLHRQAFLAGPKTGLVDACIAPFVRQFARTDRAWFDAQPWLQLAQWLAAFENSEAFAAVMHKHPLWVSPQDSTLPA